MCIGCHWAQYRDFIAGATPQGANGLTRRQALRGALFTASAVAAVTAAPSFIAEAVAAMDDGADIVFRNGPVYTVGVSNPWARAVAVKGKRIAFVGDDAGVQSFIGPQTRVVDLAGKMLLPGFVEGHIHPLGGATMARGANVQFNTRDELLDALRAYHAKVGNPNLVRGFGWRYGAFPPTGPRKEDLDAIWPDVPVILIAIDGHSAWVNSQALALAGITKNTKDPLPGFSYFERDPTSGEPSGYLVEPPAMFMVNNAIEPFSPEFVAKGLEDWLPAASAAGITALYDAGTVMLPEAEGYGIYARLEREGKLPFRVVGSYYHNKPEIDPVPVILALQREFHSELVRASVLKLNLDGGDAQRTGAFLAPYADAPDTRGETLLPPDLFADIVRRADRAGLNIHIHSFGDRATRLSLDAFEAAIKANPPRDRRHAIAHLYLVDPADLPRFARLGVVAQFSGQWAAPEPYWQEVSLPRMGAARAQNFYRIRSVLDHGAVVSLGTDWPASAHYSTYRPLDAIEIATTRRELDSPEGPQLPPVDEVVGLDAALKAATMGPAWQIGMDREIGSIEAGKLADLVVLERNLFEIPAHEIHKTKVVMTVMNGQVRHG